MTGRTVWLPTMAIVALLLGLGAPQVQARPLSEVGIWFEINDTDGDAGIQIFLDGEGWDKMKVKDPDGNTILNFKGKGSVGIQGITELFFESAEPSFDEQPLADLLALFPEGTYVFKGMTTDGHSLKGKAMLTHALPAAPLQVFPKDGEDVDPEDAVFEWAPVADPPGSEIVSYHVVVECEEPALRKLEADVGPMVTTLTVAPEVLDGADECKWEVLAIEESGNQTISETEFGID